MTMKRPFRRRPRTEFIEDPRTPDQRARDAEQIAAYERSHPVDDAKLQAARRRARELWQEKERARHEIGDMGLIPFVVHPEESEEGWVAREPHLLLEATGRSKRDAIDALVRFIHEQMLVDPIRVLGVLRARHEPESVTVEI